MASPKTLATVFVYGTLRQGFTNPGRDLLEQHATFQANATTHGALFELDRLPILVPDDEETVQGEIYTLQAPQAGLAALDRYEGAAGTDPGPYQRRAVQARLETGEIVEAWTYVWTGPVHGADPVPSGDYVAYVASQG